MKKILRDVLLLASAFFAGSGTGWAAGSADAVARLQKTPEAQRQVVLEEEAKKEGTFSFYGTMAQIVLCLASNHVRRLLTVLDGPNRAQ